MLTLLCICIASLSSAVMVYAEGESSPFTATWTHSDGDIGSMKYYTDEDGTTTILHETVANGKNRAWFDVTGHTVAAYPKLKVVYSCNKAFTLYLSINSTSSELEYSTVQQPSTEQEGGVVVKTYDI